MATVSTKQKVIIIQPPLVQLNAPYPSGAYLSAFFRKMGMETQWHDMSLELYSAIFSKEGLHTLFGLTAKEALKKADKAMKDGDENTAYNLRRYVSESDLWEQWINPINSILTSGSGGGSSQSGRELATDFCFLRIHRADTECSNILMGLTESLQQTMQEV